MAFGPQMLKSWSNSTKKGVGNKGKNNKKSMKSSTYRETWRFHKEEIKEMF